jgi:hypothetical protein
MRRWQAAVAGVVAGGVAASAALGIAAPGDRTDPGATTEWLTAKVGDALGRVGVVTWVPTGSFASSADVRVPRYPFGIGGRETQSLALDAVRNEQASGQLAVAASHALDDLSATVGQLRGPGGATLGARVRYTRYVPVMRSKSETDWSATIDQVSSAREVSGDRNPDVVGDPLEDAPSVDVPAYAAQPVWFTFRVPEDAAAGTYTGTVTLRARSGLDEPVTYPLTIEVADVTLPDPSDFSFVLDVWAQPETVADAAGVPLWSKAHWSLLAKYFRDLAAHGQETISTAIVDNPWHHQWSLGTRRSQTALPYTSLVGWRWDGLRFSFDFARFDAYVEAARSAGLGPRIGAYSMLAFQDREHLTYTDAQSGEVVRENVELGGTRWQEAWGAFLRAFEAHLRDRGWLQDAWLSFDERPLGTMTVVRDFVHRVAPTFDSRIAVAGSVNTAGIASTLSVDWGGLDRLTPELVEQRRSEGRTTTFYTYGLPAHPNTLAYSPAVEARMLPWIAAQRRLDGFLRWSYNSWPRDVFREPVFIFTQGDEYLVYPGPDGPMSSVRWEQLLEGIEDYELVAMLRRRDGGADGEALTEALSLATRDLDGREKDPGDMTQARRLVVQELTR